MKSKSAPGPPMTLGNMRSIGVRVLDVGCLTCHHQFRPGVDRYASDVPVSHFGALAGLHQVRHARRRHPPELEEQPPISQALRRSDRPEVSLSDCLHCDINELVRQHLERSDPVDLADVAARMAESLVDLILLAPDEQQGSMLAETISNLGHAFLEKTDELAGESDTTH